MIHPGDPSRPGATPEDGGVNFVLYSSAAGAVELCLFDAAGRETARHRLPECSNGHWHGFLPGCKAGQRYGYRVHGDWDPTRGLRSNPNKLLMDPRARTLDGEFRWSPAVYDYEISTTNGIETDLTRPSQFDSAPFVPRSVVTAAAHNAPLRRPDIPWAESILYEANVRGFTMRHPAVPERDRGRFEGMRNGAVLEYLRALGITTIELMPVQAFIDEAFLSRRGLRNFWGYNTISFFAPAARYAHAEPASEFRQMVDAIHDADLEVILDVAYNHTGESDALGPSLSFRGIDNLAYYRTEPGRPDRYVNYSGCGNTFNADHPEARSLIIDSLCYWHREMGVDGFRFDLGTVLGRDEHGFEPQHALLRSIESEPRLANTRLIAEPWDPGPNGYQLGGFGPRWAEWNDRFRDSARRFWRGDTGESGEFAKRLHGSADLFEYSGRDPGASINLVTSHDGFTLADVTAFEHKRNEPNGEENRDGHQHNYSFNCGSEGESGDDRVLALRRRQRLNLLATLLFSRGIPMLLAGDEFGNSQQGNNNAYAQDNQTGWLDWSGLARDPGFSDTVRSLIALRRRTPLLHRTEYPHGERHCAHGWPDIHWLRPDGQEKTETDWPDARALTLVLTDTETERDATEHSVAILFNARDEDVDFQVPQHGDLEYWRVAFCSAGDLPVSAKTGGFRLPAHSIACLLSSA